MHADKNAPDDCPFCRIVNGRESEYDSHDDIVYKDNLVTAFVAPKWYPNTPGHVLVIPNQHYKSVYDTPDDTFAHIAVIAQKLAVAERAAYAKCEGVTIRQNNEWAAGQRVLHLHVHVIPRYKDDGLYEQPQVQKAAEPTQRRHYADLLRTHLT